MFLTVENSSEFVRKGLDLIYRKSISLCDALCGFTFDINHINGQTYTINNKLDNIITPNFRKEIPNLGIEMRKSHR